jgi:hypothetical protein
MKLAQVNKLYDKLTPTEQANLSFEALTRHDDAELAAILDAVPLQTYQQPHFDYRSRSYGLLMVSLVYGSMYWKAKALILANQKPDENAVFLAAIDVALKNACIQLNIDIDAIRTLAQCKRQPLMTECPKPELVAEYTEIFTSMAR